MTMKKQLTYITPLRAGIVLGVLYGILYFFAGAGSSFFVSSAGL